MIFQPLKSNTPAIDLKLYTLLSALFHRETTLTMFNQYQHGTILRNLEIYLRNMIFYQPKILLVGEAAGYKGCRRTGIPFTSGWILGTHRIYNSFNELNYSRKDKEATASIIYSVITPDMFNHIIFWNAFPFHPHLINNPNSNRKPTRNELTEGLGYLEQLCAIFGFTKYAGIGRSGQSVLEQMLHIPEVIFIPHPSYGEKRAFTDALYQFLISTQLITLEPLRYRQQRSLRDF